MPNPADTPVAPAPPAGDPLNPRIQPQVGSAPARARTLLAPVDRSFLTWLIGGVLADQLTKRAVVSWLDLGDRSPVVRGFFDLAHVQNDAAAFGMMGDVDGRMRVFAAITVVFTAGLLFVQRTVQRRDVLLHGLIGLLLSGVLGNAIDRWEKGSVTDFLLFYVSSDPWRSRLIDTFGMASWPAFNIADASLLTAAVALIVHAATAEVDPDPFTPPAA